MYCVPIVNYAIIPSNKRVHQPELQVFNIVPVKIDVGCDGPGNTRPVGAWIVVEKACTIEVGVKIVWAALRGVVGHVKYGQVHVQHFTVSTKDLLWCYSSDIVVPKIIVSQVTWFAKSARPVKNIVNDVPG